MVQVRDVEFRPVLHHVDRVRALLFKQVTRPAAGRAPRVRGVVLMRRRVRGIVAGFAMAMVSAAAAAQDGSGTITLIVRDTSGAAIPGVTVRIVDESTTAAVDAVSDARGSYEGTLAPGAYRVETRLDGFDADIRRIAIEIAKPVALDVTLSPSRLTESVMVTA